MKDPYKKKDEELFKEVLKVKNGDDSSCQRIYELSEKYIYKIINDIVKNHHTTEDLMQEAYIQIYNKLDTLQEAKAFYVWAGRIATNLTLRYIQKNSKEVLATPDEEGETDFIFDKASEDNEKFIPESVLVDREKQRLLADIIDNLSTEQKFCVQYFYYEEMSVNEIAELMGCSAGTVKSRLNYARKSIKDAVIELDVKHGTRLYGLASAPLFLIIFRAAAEGLLPAAVAGAASAAGVVSVGGASSAGSVASAGGASSAGSVASAGGAATTIGAATSTVATKVAVFLGAAMILGGGASTAVNASDIVSPQQVEVVAEEETEEVIEEVVEEAVAEEETVSIDVDIVVEAPVVEEAPEYVPYEEPKEEPKKETVKQPTQETQEQTQEETEVEIKDYEAAYIIVTYLDGSTQRFEIAEYNADMGIIYNYGKPVKTTFYNAAGQEVGGITQEYDSNGQTTGVIGFF